jgi:hypothetical protein
MRKIPVYFIEAAIAALLLIQCTKTVPELLGVPHPSPANAPVAPDKTIVTDIKSATVWNDAATAHKVRDTLQVYSLLLIDSGVTVELSDSALIMVHAGGRIRAQSGVEFHCAPGSRILIALDANNDTALECDGVLFTSDTEPLVWEGIQIESYYNVGIRLSHCTIEKARIGIHATQNARGTIRLSYCVLRCNTGCGIDLDSAYNVHLVAASIADSANGGYGLRGEFLHAVHFSGTNRFAGNDSGGVLIDGCSLYDSAVLMQKLDVPYEVATPLFLSGSARMTIMAGVRLAFRPSAYISMGGTYTSTTLIASGTQNDSIVFTNAIPDSFWGKGSPDSAGIAMKSGTSDTTAFSYCIIENAVGGMLFNEARASVTHCAIRNNLRHGVEIIGALGPKDSTAFADNVITGNKRFGMVLEAAKMKGISGTNRVAGNDSGGIRIMGGYVGETVVWKKLDAPYLIALPVLVGSGTGGGNLIISPGVHILFRIGTYISVGQYAPGSFSALGAAGDSICFSPVDTGTYWGSTNYNSAYNAGIMFENQTVSAVLSYCVVEHANNGVRVDADAWIQNCSIRNNRDYAIQLIKPDLDNSITNNDYPGNGLGDINVP